MEDLLTVKDLVKHYPIKRGVVPRTIGYVRAVDGVSFSIESGTTLGLVGESGCGKTTVGRCVLRLVEPTAGEVTFDGRNLLELDARQMRDVRRECQIVFQDPYGSLNPRMTIGAIVEEPLFVRGAGVNGSDERKESAGSHPLRVRNTSFFFSKADRVRARKRCDELLDLVGIQSALAGRYPHELSGGQRQRVCIARALTTHPRLIVCDEPVSALDVSVQAQILNLLSDLQAQFSLTYLFIAHDLSVVRHISKQVAVMYLGQIVEEAPTDEMFLNPLHPYTQALLASIPVPDPKAKHSRTRARGDLPSTVAVPEGCRFRPRCPIAIDECGKINPPLVELSAGHKVACIRTSSDVMEATRSLPLPVP